MKLLVLFDKSQGGEFIVNYEVINWLKERFGKEIVIVSINPQEYSGLLSGSRYLLNAFKLFISLLNKIDLRKIQVVLTLSSLSLLVTPWIKKRHPDARFIHLFHGDRSQILPRPDSVFRLPQYLYGFFLTSSYLSG